MNLKSLLSIWLPFAATSLLTLLIYTTLWAIGSYWALLSIFGIFCGVFAARIIARTGLRWWPVVWVAVGLIIGQWWLIELMIMQLFWKSKGFGL